MKTLRFILCLFAAMAYSSVVYAQDSSEFLYIDDGADPDGSFVTVGLDSCRAMALKHNKQLRIAREAVRAAGYQRREAFAAYLPGIDFVGGYMYNQKKISVFDSDQLLPVKNFDLATQSYQFDVVKNPMTGEPITVNGQPVPSRVALIPKEAMTFDTHNVFFGAITLTQPVFMGGKIIAMNRLAKYGEEAKRALAENTEDDIIYAVDAAYWQVVSLRAKQELAVSYVNLLDSLRHDVALMFEQGIVTRADLLAVEVKLNEANVDLTKVNNGVILSRMALAQICGLPVDTPLNPADNAPDDADFGLVATDYNMADVWSRRADLRALDYGVKAADQQSRVALSSMLPNIAVIGSYEFSNPNMFNGFKKRFDGQFSVGAMLTIPLWHWGGNYNKYRAAKSEVLMMQLRLEDAREMITLQVRQSAFRTREALKTQIMTRSNVAKAEENLRQASLAFREGMMTSENVMAAQTAWLKAGSENIDADIDVALCHTYLARVLGTLNY